MRRDAWIIFISSFLIYAYFFQGSGWNQLAHFSTMRSLAEHGSADISRFHNLTGDVTFRGEHIYSNKPPGIALLGTTIYFVLMKIERAMRFDIGATKVWLTNLYLMTILLSSLPAALTNVQLYYLLRRTALARRTALFMVGAFAFGSLSLPYGGILMSHTMTALLILLAWHLLSRSELTSRKAIIAGVLMGLGILCDLLTVPVAGVMALYLLARRPRAKVWVGYCLATAWGLLATLLYNRLAHGSALSSGPFHPAPQMGEPGLLVEQFGYPEWMRIYWITYHPMRGLFLTCPIFIACLMSALMIRRPIRVSLELITILFILSIYVLFYLTFNGWTGGWAIGPRYLIPALPLLWLLAAPAFVRLPKICALLTVLSIVQMLAVTSINAQLPEPNTVLVEHSDPVRACLISFVRGQTNQTLDGWNVGQLLHVPEHFQLVPIYLLLSGFYCFAWISGESGSESAAGL